MIFFAYIGFDAVSTAAQETKTPQRDLPVGILGSLLACTVLFVLYTYVLTGLVNYRLLNVAAPLSLALKRLPEQQACHREERDRQRARPQVSRHLLA